MDDASVRADVWLWVARFFKTRRLCREAIDGGQVDLNGYGCKPGKAVKPGDELVITRQEERFHILVLALADRRGSASVAQSLYREYERSVTARMQTRELNRLAGRAAPSKRPNKRARRELVRLKKG